MFKNQAIRVKEMLKVMNRVYIYIYIYILYSILGLTKYHGL
jgi:hypothetical protein